MEAARIPWRPLGRILVEQGLLTSEELETALEQQERTGKRLGETIVECGFVSGPELSSALASQYGIELTTETGFGTGLRGQIQRRHENERRSARPTLVDVNAYPGDVEEAIEEPTDLPEETPAEASLLTQLEEQWALLAAAEALLAEREHELAQLAAQRDRRRHQAERLARRARSRSTAPAAVTDTHELEQARHAVAAAEAALADQERRVDELGIDFAHVVRSRTDLEETLGAAQDALAERERSLEDLHHTLGRKRAQTGRFVARLLRQRAEARDARAREAELEETRRELEHTRGTLDSAEAVAAEHQHRFEGLAGELEQARGAVAERDSGLENLRHELEHTRAALAAAESATAAQHERQEQLASEFEAVVNGRAELEGELAATRQELERRREQARRFASRLRREQGDDTELESLRRELDQARAAVAAADEAAAEQRHRVDELSQELARGAQAHTEVQEQLSAAQAALAEHGRQAEELSRELERVADVHSEAEGQRSATEAALAERDRRIGELGRELETIRLEQDNRAEELSRRLERRRAQAVRLVTRLQRLRHLDDEQLTQIERLVADVRGCDEEIARLRQENERVTHELAELAASHEPAPLPEVASHLVFVQLADRYELVERPGPPPARNTAFGLPDLETELVAAGLRRSPLPGDARPCVVAEPTATLSEE